MNYDANSVEDDLGGLRGGIKQVQQDFATLQADEVKVPSYRPRGLPNQAAVNSAIGSANGAISSALSTTNGYIDQVNADVTTAYGDTATAFEAGGCGAPPAAPDPSRISAEVVREASFVVQGEAMMALCRSRSPAPPAG